jgi:hypothetical protein
MTKWHRIRNKDLYISSPVDHSLNLYSSDTTGCIYDSETRVCDITYDMMDEASAYCTVNLKNVVLVTSWH